MLATRACFGHAPKRLRLVSTSPCVRHATTTTGSVTPEPESVKDPTIDAQTSQILVSSVARREATTMRTYRPKTPGIRHLKRPLNDHLYKGGPIRALTFVKTGHAKGGRNNTGRIAVRHRGGGHRRRIRTVDYVRSAPGPHTVERIEYDPNRTAHLALLRNEQNGDRSYVIAAEGLRAGDVVESFRAGIPDSLVKSMGGNVDPGVLAAKTAFRGNCLPMHMVPIGTQVFNVGSHGAKFGAVFCRSAGTFAMVMSKEEKGNQIKSVAVRLQSGEVRRVAPDACATIGVASNPMNQFAQLGKAGRSRWKNIRPTVRGVAMNACDHAHGGGRGKSKGNVHPQSIWGTPAKSGYKTRLKRNPNRWIVKERERNQGKRRSKGK